MFSLGGVKSLYGNGRAWVRLEMREERCFQVRRGLRQGCGIFNVLFS